MPTRTMPRQYQRFFVFFNVILCVALAFIYWRGYVYNAADQAEHLPQVLHSMDKNLYQNDFFIREYIHTFTIRQYYVWYVLAAAWAWGGSVFWACFVGCVACAWVFVYGLLRLYQVYDNGRFGQMAGFVYAFLVLFVTYNCTLGGNNVLYATFICSTISKAFVPLALVFFIDKKRVACVVLLGFVSWFQVLVGLQLAVVLGIVYAWQSMKLWKPVGFFVGYCVCAAPILVPIFYIQFIKNVHLSVLEQRQFADILYYFRNPNHFVPGAFGVGQYVKFMIILVMAVAIWRGVLSKKMSDIDDFIQKFVVICVAGMVVYTVGFGHFEVLFLAKTQWFKVSIWVVMLCCLPVVQFFMYKIDDGKKLYFYLNKYIKYGVAAVVIINMGLMGVILQKSLYNAPTDLQKMHFWIKKNTAINAQILTFVDDDSFGCEAQRSQPVEWKAVIHEPLFMIAWKQRIDDLYFGGKYATKKSELSLKNIDKKMLVKYKIDYILYKKTDDKGYKNGRMVYETAGYELMAIEK